MSCLLPQFKCQPDTFSVNSKLHSPSASTFPPKQKSLVCFRVQCVVSSATHPTMVAQTAVLDREELKLPPFGANSNSIAACQLLSSLSTIDSPTEARVESTLATETLINNEEAVIFAAAAEAVALAHAAAKLAKEAALMVHSGQDAKLVAKSKDLLSYGDEINNQYTLLLEKEIGGAFSNSLGAGSDLGEGYSINNPIVSDSECVEPTTEELELLQLQLSESVAVRSKRQVERKAKRARAAEKSAARVPIKPSFVRRKRPTAPEVKASDPLRYIRGTANGSKLLTVSEEIELSEGIQDLLKLEKIYEEIAERFGGEPSFGQWADAVGVDQKTLRKRLNYGIHCKDSMIKSNIRLVISIAKNYQRIGMSLQDLVQEGCKGLVRGAEKFDASKGFKFSTYAHWWIRQAVRRSLTDQSRMIRVPYHIVEAGYRVKEAKRQFYNKHGRQPKDEEVAAATGLTMKRLNTVLRIPKAPRSLDQKIGYDLSLKPSDIISAPDAKTNEELLIKQLMKEDLQKVLNTLTKRERQVIRWRFGMEDGRMKTLQEIGELMGVSRERIRQVEASAFRKLKNKRRTKHLQQYAFL